MKVVCINNKVSRLDSKGFSYTKIDPILVIGKIYEIYMTPVEFEICSVVGIVDNKRTSTYEIIGDRVYDKELFITLEEWRELQLNKLDI